MAENNEEQDFIAEFRSISQEKILREYEKKNRDRISESSLILRSEFDSRWKTVTGNNYYMPVTTIPATPSPKKGEKSDPRSRSYKAKVNFSHVYWVKTRRRIAKKFREFYTLTGIADGAKRPIYQNLSADRIIELFGDKDAPKILDSKETKGALKGSFNLLVEGYWEVEFAPRGTESDPVDVELFWEGICLIVKRMSDVVLPGYYLEVADHTIKDNYVHNEKVGRQKVGVIQMYQYTTKREATREEYLNQKAAGDRIAKEKQMRDEG